MTPKLIIPPHVLASLEEDLDPSELQSFLDELKMKVETGAIFSESQPVDMETLRVEDPELYNVLVERFSEIETPVNTQLH